MLAEESTAIMSGELEVIDLSSGAPLGVADEPLTPEEEARSVGVEERDVHEQQAQRCDVHYRFTWVSGARREEVIEHRYLYPKQLPEMLESAGLVEERWWRDFEPGAPDEETEQWALSARLKGPSRGGTS